MAHLLFRLTAATLFSTAILSAPNIAEGQGFGFKLQNTTSQDGILRNKWVPTRALLDEQQIHMENYHILDPVTNKTILNPANESPLSKRNDFSAYNGAESRMVFMHHYIIAQCCGGQRCEDCSTETTEFRILATKTLGVSLLYWVWIRAAGNTTGKVNSLPNLMKLIIFGVQHTEHSL